MVQQLQVVQFALKGHVIGLDIILLMSDGRCILHRVQVNDKRILQETL